MGNGYPHSTIAQILEDIIDQLSFEGESHSNIADILLSILNQTSYDKEPYSVLAELFLKLKAKIEGEPFDPYDKETHSVIAEILVSILNETEYTDVPQSRIAELLLELKEELEAYTEITVSGSIVSFLTNVAKPLVDLKVAVTATQSGNGDPSPDNVRPISGWSACTVTRCGINLWDEQWELGRIDSSGENVPSTTQIRSTGYIPVKNGTKIRIVNPDRMYLVYYDKSKNYVYNTVAVGNSNINVPDSIYYIRFTMSGSYGKTYNHDISLNYPSTDTDYHAYNGNTYIINLGGTYYGGVLDVDSGVLTVDKIIKKMSNITFSVPIPAQPHFFRGIISDANNVRADVICEVLKTVGTVSLCQNTDLTIYKSDGTSLYIHDDTCSDNAEIQAKYDNYSIVYGIATPFEVQLTPTQVQLLKDNNTIFADTGDIKSLTYLYRGTPET